MNKLSPESLTQIFTQAHTHTHWLEKPLSDDTLKEIYHLLRWAPTSANCSPARIMFIKSPEAKARLLPCMSPGNVEKTRLAPATAIIAEDHKFYDNLPKLFPHTDARSWFVGNDALIHSTATRNSVLQGAYLIIAARALGVDCGPMSGFDNAKVDAEFFAGTSLKSNFLVNLGYGDASKLQPRNPRLDFAEACKIL